VTEALPDIVPFGTFFYKHDSYEGTCDEWNSYRQNDISLPFDYLYIDGLYLTYSMWDYGSGEMRYEEVSCNEQSGVDVLLNALTAEDGEGEAYCGTTHLWRVVQCQGEPILCVDCDTSACQSNTTATPYPPICPGQYPMGRDRELYPKVINPCSPCHEHKDSYAVLGFSVAIATLYPEFRNVTVDPDRDAIAMTVNISKPGVVYCGAFDEGYVPTSITEVTSQSFYISTSSSGEFTFSLTGLVPDYHYSLYCYTEDYVGHLMDLEDVLETAVNVTTDCCKAITITNFVSARLNDSTDAYAFALDALPEEETNVTVVLTNISPCNYTEGSLPMDAVAIPSRFTFTPGSLSNAADFIVQGTPGCYEVVISEDVSLSRRALRELTHTTSYDSTSQSVVLRSSKNNPDAPHITTAQFQKNPSKISLYFDSLTNKGEGSIAGYDGYFSCSSMFDVSSSDLGIENALCLWSTPKLLVISLAKGDVNLSPGDSIELLNGVVAPCGDCCPLLTQPCPAAVAQVVTLLAPADPLVPSTALSTSAVIGECDEIVLDPSQSTGAGGRSWTDVKWTISSSDDTNATAMSIVNSQLNSQYSSTRQRASISNRFLTAPATYTIKLQLTNFLGETNTASVEVTVRNVEVQPKVSIDGKQKLVKKRSMPISLFAIASVPVCEGTTAPTGLTFSWKVYIGSKYVSSIKSISKDPRYFKLEPYTLDINTVYTVYVTVTVEGVTASKSVTISVESAGSFASILGGAKRSGSTKTVTVFESASYDIDYPTDEDALEYIWSCVEVSPNFGDDCPTALIGRNTSVASIAADAFKRSADATYKVSLFVMSVFSHSTSSASAVLEMVSAEIPDIVFGASAEKYNANQKIILSSTVSTIDSAWVTWNSSVHSALEWSSKTLTQTQYQVPTGDTICELAIAANALTAGATYVFVLSATYSDNRNQIDKFEEITVIMNSPPTNGQLEVVPANGTSLDTEFFFQTFDWEDDVDDYPLVYIMQIYVDVAASSKTVIKTSGETTYTTTTLGQGLEENAFAVWTEVEAMDVYGSKATSVGNITVAPISEAALSDAMDSQLEEAFASSDPVAVSNVINAVSSSLNTIDCTVPTACATLNREKCRDTPKTCGSCLEGYLGSDGDSNNMCSDPTVLRKVGSECTAHANCISSYCLDSVCSQYDKACDNDCSGNGQCQFASNSDESQLTSCPEGSSTCYAHCVCDSGWNGGDCSLDASNFENKRNIRENLCASIYDTVAIQDLTEDVVLSRCTTLNGLLRDPTQLSTSAINNCTLALIETITQGAEYAGLDEVSDTATDTLSGVLLLDLDAGLLANVSSALEALTSAVQDNLAVGEDQKSFNTETTRIGCSVVDPNALNGATFSPPQSDAELFNEQDIASLALEMGASSSAVGVSVLLYNNNPSGSMTDSTPIGLRTISYGTVGARRRRRLAEAGYGGFQPSTRSRRLQTDDIAVTVELKNSDSVFYYSIAATSGTVNCSGESNYTESVSCPIMDNSTWTEYNQDYHFDCVEGQAGSMSFTCPASERLPDCQSAAGSDEFSSDSTCTLVSYTDTVTTCSCSMSSGARRRRLEDKGLDGSVGVLRPNEDSDEDYDDSADDWSSKPRRGRRLSLESSAESELRQFTATANIIGSGFGRSFSALNSMDADDDPNNKRSPAEKFVKVVNGNATIFYFMLTFLSLLVFGLVSMLFKDHRQVHNWTREEQAVAAKKENVKRHRDITAFFDDVVPYEFSGLPWITRFKRRLITDHDWVSAFLPYSISKNESWVQFVLGMTKVMNFIFVDTILAGLFFADDGTCETYTNEEDCTFLRSLRQTDSLCTWTFDDAGYANATAYYNTTRYYNGTDLYQLYGSCEFGSASGDFTSVLAVVIILTLVTIPFDRLTETLVMKTAAMFSVKNRYKHALTAATSAIGNQDGDDKDGAASMASVREDDNDEIDNSIASDNELSETISGGAVIKPSAIVAAGGTPSPRKQPQLSRNDTTGSEGSEQTTMSPSQFESDYWMYATEVDNLQSLKSTLYRAARLSIMQRDMDDCTVEEEANTMMKIMDSDMFDLSNVVNTLEIQKYALRASSYTSSVARFFQHLWYRLEDPAFADTGLRMLAAERVGLIVGATSKSIARAREVSDDIVEHLEGMESDPDRDSYLLQRFILDSLQGYERLIANRYLEDVEEDSEGATNMNILYFGFLLVWTMFVCFYVFLFGVVLGPKAVDIWLKGCMFSFLQAVFLLQPIRIFLDYIVLAGVPSDRLRKIHSTLRQRVKGMLSRTAGLVKGANSIIQHLNPACRASRRFPHLRMSRILMSINDNDIPLSALLSSDNSGLISAIVDVLWVFLLVLALMLIVVMPDSIGDSLLDVAASLAVNGVLVFGVSLSEIGSIALPVCLFLAIGGFVVHHEYNMYHKKKNSKWAFDKPSGTYIDVTEEEKLDAELDEAIKARKALRTGQKSSWQSRVHKSVLVRRTTTSLVGIADDDNDALMMTALKDKMKQDAVEEEEDGDLVVDQPPPVFLGRKKKATTWSSIDSILPSSGDDSYGRGGVFQIRIEPSSGSGSGTDVEMRRRSVSPISLALKSVEQKYAIPAGGSRPVSREVGSRGGSRPRSRGLWHATSDGHINTNITGLQQDDPSIVSTAHIAAAKDLSSLFDDKPSDEDEEEMGATFISRRMRSADLRRRPDRGRSVGALVVPVDRIDIPAADVGNAVRFEDNNDDGDSGNVDDSASVLERREQYEFKRAKGEERRSRRERRRLARKAREEENHQNAAAAASLNNQSSVFAGLQPNDMLEVYSLAPSMAQDGASLAMMEEGSVDLATIGFAPDMDGTSVVEGGVAFSVVSQQEGDTNIEEQGFGKLGESSLVTSVLAAPTPISLNVGMGSAVQCPSSAPMEALMSHSITSVSGDIMSPHKLAVLPSIGLSQATNSMVVSDFADPNAIMIAPHVAEMMGAKASAAAAMMAHYNIASGTSNNLSDSDYYDGQAAGGGGNDDGISAPATDLFEHLDDFAPLAGGGNSSPLQTSTKSRVKNKRIRRFVRAKQDSTDSVLGPLAVNSRAGNKLMLERETADELAPRRAEISSLFDSGEATDAAAARQGAMSGEEGESFAARRNRRREARKKKREDEQRLREQEEELEGVGGFEIDMAVGADADADIAAAAGTDFQHQREQAALRRQMRPDRMAGLKMPPRTRTPSEVAALFSMDGEGERVSDTGHDEGSNMSELGKEDFVLSDYDF
jgi:hypothetical protein